MRRTNAESSDTFTAKQGFFDRTLAPHTDRLGVSCRVQANALLKRQRVRFSGKDLSAIFRSRIAAKLIQRQIFFKTRLPVIKLQGVR